MVISLFSFLLYLLTGVSLLGSEYFLPYLFVCLFVLYQYELMDFILCFGYFFHSSLKSLQLWPLEPFRLASVPSMPLLCFLGSLTFMLKGVVSGLLQD